MRIRTTARVDRAFVLQSFDFLLDPGTGPTTVRGVVEGRRLTLSVTTAGGTTTEVRELSEPPVLSISLGRRLAGAGLVAGARHQWALFDPATLRNAPVVLDVGPREVVSVSGVGMPAFRVDMEFAGLHTRSWVTDTGEVVKEESPMGLDDRPRERARRAGDVGRLGRPARSARGVRGRADDEAAYRRTARRAAAARQARRRVSSLVDDKAE